jgi:hypothetical protein
MSLTRVFRALALPLVPCLLAAGLACPARAGDGGCGLGLFCPVTLFWRSKSPCPLWACSCPRPVCNPCTLAQNGYHFPNWRPWGLPVCDSGGPGSPYLGNALSLPGSPGDSLPAPRKMKDHAEVQP